MLNHKNEWNYSYFLTAGKNFETATSSVLLIMGVMQPDNKDKWDQKQDFWKNWILRDHPYFWLAYNHNLFTFKERLQWKSQVLVSFLFSIHSSVKFHD